MSDKAQKVDGKTTSAGRVKLTLNPPAAKKEGVTYKGHWVRAELDDEGNFTVRIFGQAQYGDRDSSNHVDLTDEGLEPIKEMLEQVLEAYGDVIKTTAMESAFVARAFAIAQGESITATPEEEKKEK